LKKSEKRKKINNYTLLIVKKSQTYLALFCFFVYQFCILYEFQRKNQKLMLLFRRNTMNIVEGYISTKPIRLLLNNCLRMKNRILQSLILMLVLGLTFSCKPANKDLKQCEFIIDSIKHQAVPDSRVEIFSIKSGYSGQSILLTGKSTKPEAVEQLKKALTLQKINFIDSIVRLPDPSLGDKTWGMVNLSVANLRSNPAHAAEMATQALMGTPLKVLQKEKTWYLVQTPDQYIAWVDSAEIISLTIADLSKWKLAEKVIYLSDNGLIMSNPDKASRPVSDVVMGSILAVDNSEKNHGPYVAVLLPDGRKGYVDQQDCTNFLEWSQTVRPDTIAMMKRAFSLFGRPYLWGGTSSKAMDCSGFVKSIYQMSGMILSRDASQQVNQGTEVPMKDIWRGLKAGDLLFFGRLATQKLPERVTHVGMYIGDSEFIHSSVMVKINSLDSTRTGYKPYYHTHLLHVRRLIDTTNPTATFKSHTWYQ